MGWGPGYPHFKTIPDAIACASNLLVEDEVDEVSGQLHIAYRARFIVSLTAIILSHVESVETGWAYRIWN